MNRSLLAVSLCTVVSLATTTLADDWPQWRGPQRDGVSAEKGLLQAWSEGGPERLWLFSDAGLGYSAFSVVGDTLYTMGARGEEEFVIAVNVTSGKEKWSSPISVIYKEGRGDGPRCTPTIEGDRLYALTGNGTVACLKVADGAVVWKAEMQSFGGRVPRWGYSESLLVDGDKVVCTPGGEKGAVIALNKGTGDVIWQSKDFIEGAQYASMIAVEHNGKRQYIQLTQAKLAGLDATSGDEPAGPPKRNSGWPSCRRRRPAWCRRG